MLRKITSFLFVLLIQTVIILSFLLRSPSEPGRAILLGFSSVKIFLFSINFFALIILTTILITTKTSPSIMEKGFSRIKVFINNSIGGYLVFGSMAVSNLILLSGLFALLTGTISTDQHSELFRIFINSLPFITYWWVLSIEIFIFLTLTWGWDLNLFDVSEKTSRLIKSRGFTIFWIACITITGVFHWLILIFNWPLFDLIPFWYWQTISKTNPTSWLIIPLVLLLFVGYYLLQSTFLSNSKKTLLVMLIGYLMMIGFTAIEGDPYQVLYDKRYISGHRSYIAVAARNEGGQEFLYDYESALGHDRFYATKPPGVYMLYRSLLGIGSVIFPVETYEQKYDAINHTSMLLLPLFALATTIFVEKLTRTFTDINPANLPGYLLIIIPNFLLLTVTIDQSIIPFLFTSGLLLGILAINKKSFWLSLIFGLFLYIGLYFSFSLLPLVPLLGLWIVLEIFRDWKTYNFNALRKFVLGSLSGFAILFLFFLLVFNYSPLARYQSAIAVHEMQRYLPTTISNYLDMYLLNNVEMATWIGFPLAVTSIMAISVSAINLFWGKWKSIDSMALAFTGTYLFVNHFSNTLSEVGRLWIFFVPLICIITADFLQNRMQKKSYMLFFLLLQLITAFMIVQHLRITWE